ncbi:MAG: ribonuclease [Acidobacteriota bacterium]
MSRLEPSRSERRLLPSCLLVAWLVSIGAGSVGAEVPMEGHLIARSPCPAPVSIRKGTNPGNVRLEIDHAYELLAGNKTTPSHYLVRVRGARPERRWVAVDCGEHVVPATAITSRPEPRPASGPRPATAVLAISWQPAFCETRERVPECASQVPERYDASHFSLHGLWPQPRSNAYCDVAPKLVALDKKRLWKHLPELPLSAPLRRRLDESMPGTQSGLQRHEWIKHGTCYGSSAEEYYADSLQLLDELNASAVRELFVERLGERVSTKEIRRAFDEAFGPGAGERVRVACRDDGGRRLIVELTLGLVGKVEDDSSLSALLLAAAPTDAGCPGGIVDPALFQ